MVLSYDNPYVRDSIGYGSIERLNDTIRRLQAKGAVGLSILVGKNCDASLENLAQDTLVHIEATTSSEGVNIANLRF